MIKLYNESCYDVLPKLKIRVALVLTDPPFGVNYQNNYTHSKHKKIHGDDAVVSYEKWGRLAFRLLRNNAALFAFTGWSEYSHNYSEIERCGFGMREPLIIQKRPSGKTDLYGSFQTNTDWIIFAHKGRFKFRKTELIRNKKAGTIPNKGRKPVPEYKTRFPSCWMGEDYPWSTENPQTAKQWNHPTVKSVELLEWLILLSTDENDIVLDPFMGTGSCGVAAKNTGRKFIGMEIDENHYQTSMSRIDANNQ